MIRGHKRFNCILRSREEENNCFTQRKNLNYVQSGVTMRMKQLENELGVLLFYRNGKGVTLTSNGEILLTYAKQIIQFNIIYKSGSK